MNERTVELDWMREMMALKMLTVAATACLAAFFAGVSREDNVLYAEPFNRRAVARFLKKGVPDAFVAGNDVTEAALQTLASRIKTPTLSPRTILLSAGLVVRGRNALRPKI